MSQWVIKGIRTGIKTTAYPRGAERAAGVTPGDVYKRQATDGLIIVFIMGVLVRAVQKQVGTTAIGDLASLKEGAAESAVDAALL